MEEKFSRFKREEERTGGGELMGPLREGATGEHNWVMNLLNQLVHHLLTVELL